MKKLSIVLTLPLLAAAVTVFGQQDPLTTNNGDGNSISLGSLTATPEMWFYEQENRRHDNRKLSVRRKAEFRSAQRQHRIAAQKWFGIDSARPTVSPTPWASTYGHGWVANHGLPHQWGGAAHSPVIVVTRRSTYGLW